MLQQHRFNCKANLANLANSRHLQILYTPLLTDRHLTPSWLTFRPPRGRHSALLAADILHLDSLRLPICLHFHALNHLTQNRSLYCGIRFASIFDSSAKMQTLYPSDEICLPKYRCSRAKSLFVCRHNIPLKQSGADVLMILSRVSAVLDVIGRRSRYLKGIICLPASFTPLIAADDYFKPMGLSAFRQAICKNISIVCISADALWKFKNHLRTKVVNALCA